MDEFTHKEFINQYLPRQVSIFISEPADNQWVWEYDGVSSLDYSLGFESSLDAVCHFVRYVLENDINPLSLLVD